MSAEPARRFYKTATATAEHGVALDARTLRTPGGVAFRAPTAALAEAMAAEWDAQRDLILPASMPVTQLAFAAIDHTPRRRDDLMAHVVAYGETDLVSHRAETPATLVARQAAAWDPLVAWADDALGVGVSVVASVIAAPVDPASRAKLAAFAEALDDFRLTALAHGTGLFGSAVIAAALVAGRLGADDAFAAATIDDAWSLEKWGEDAEARARLERLRTDTQALARFLAAL
jgi:chaperone required for assembly of F1-ATPase